ncbi:MAG: DUF6518 family protein [Chloroflexaceae bacterium]|nr:DUF6518 family protein [Chloroflexaceae bacterium]
MEETTPLHTRPIWMSLLAALVGGSAIGTGLIYFEQTDLTGSNAFGDSFGLWIVLTTLIAAWSATWQRATLNVVVFMVAMVVAYYGTTWLLLGYFLQWLALAWSVAALLGGPPFATLVWHSRRPGWLAALGMATPVGLLLYEAYTLRLNLERHGFLFGFDVAAAVLFLFLPQTNMQRLRVLALTPLILLVAGFIFQYVFVFVYQWVALPVPEITTHAML